MKTSPLVLALLILPTSCAGTSRLSLQDPGRLADAFEEVHTSVVTLRTISRGASIAEAGRNTAHDDVGSGTLVSEDGKILTAAHVVQTAERVVVEFFDGSRIPAKVLASDPASDTAIVQLERKAPESVKPAPLGDSNETRIGSPVFVVGAPLGIAHTLTAGHVSAKRQAPSFVGGELAIEVFQTDAAINLGNSGGPLFNMRGEVIGVVSYIVGKTGGSQGLGFAITSKTCRERLFERSPLWSGMSFLPLEGRLAEILNLPRARPGWLVQRVVEDSPAGRIGLKGGDVLAEIAGKKLLLGGDVVLAIMDEPVSKLVKDDAVSKLNLGPDDEFRITVLRAGERKELKVKWGELQ